MKAATTESLLCAGPLSPAHLPFSLSLFSLPLSPFLPLSVSQKLNGIQLPAPCVFSCSRLSPFIINRNMSSLYSFILLIWSGLTADNDMQY